MTLRTAIAKMTYGISIYFNYMSIYIIDTV